MAVNVRIADDPRVDAMLNPANRVYENAVKASPTSVPITAAFVILLVGPEMVPVISPTSEPRASLPEVPEQNDTGATASAYVRTPDAF